MLSASRVQRSRRDRDLQPDFEGMDSCDIHIGTQLPTCHSLRDESPHRLGAGNEDSTSEGAQQAWLSAPMCEAGGEHGRKVLSVAGADQESPSQSLRAGVLPIEPSGVIGHARDSRQSQFPLRLVVAVRRSYGYPCPFSSGIDGEVAVANLGDLDKGGLGQLRMDPLVLGSATTDSGNLAI